MRIIFLTKRKVSIRKMDMTAIKTITFDKDASKYQLFELLK
jgi:hypothetical protein